VKFSIEERRITFGEGCTVTGFGVFISFDSATGDLPFDTSAKWLADFYNREDAEAFKARKEKEYRA
jgi:hypothetical protein